MTRPAVGARVRVLCNTGIPGVAGQCGHVFAHHEDGVAFRVFLDLGGYLLCESEERRAAARAARSPHRERIVSGPKMRAPKTTAWRESSALMVHERAKHHARRAGFSLDVILSAIGKRESVTGSVVASVSDVVQPEGRHRTLSDFRWPIADLSDRRNVDATVALAKRWCESTADDLSTSINKIAGDFARRFRKKAANFPAPITNSPVENGPRSGHLEAK